MDVATVPDAGAAAVADTFGEVEFPKVSVCWRCNGLGKRTVKVKTKEREKGTHRTEDVECPICRGSGQVDPKRRRAQARPLKEFPGWTIPGPAPAAALLDEPVPAWVQASAGEELCFLTGQWRIFQKTDAHRYSTDDVVTAWVAWRAVEALLRPRRLPPPHAASGLALRTADIGCGIGSVLLMTAWLFPAAECTGIEAQTARAKEAARSVAFNLCPGLGREGALRQGSNAGAEAGEAASRVRVVNGDLRDPAVLGSIAATGPASFDLVTGTPPYFLVGHGALPSSENSSRCLFEYRGGIEAYCASAARLLAPDGLFVVVESSLCVERGYAGATAAGLRVLARLDAVPKQGKPSLFSVFVMCRQDAAESAYTESVLAPVLDTLFAKRGFSPYESEPQAYAKACVQKIAADRERTQAEADAKDAADESVENGIAPVDDAHLSEDPRSGDPPKPSCPPAKRPKRMPQPQKNDKRKVPGSLQGEFVYSLCVRDERGERTAEYCNLLFDMGKPA